jgi:hypothetical protein
MVISDQFRAWSEIISSFGRSHPRTEEEATKVKRCYLTQLENGERLFAQAYVVVSRNIPDRMHPTYRLTAF